MSQHLLMMLMLMHGIYPKWINGFSTSLSTSSALWIFLSFGTKAHFEIREFSPGQKLCFPQALIHGKTVLVWGTAAVVYDQEKI